MVRVTTCLSCGASKPMLVLSLGSTPLANRYVNEAQLVEPEPTFPLELQFCSSCGLVQLSEHVDPEVLFGHYLYLTGMSATMARHHEALAAGHVQQFGLTQRDLVVDVASNDGSLLGCFQRRSVRTLGIEPAVNLAEVSRAAGIATECVFFGEHSARLLRERHGKARLLTANNVLAHVPDLTGFLRGVRCLIEPDGKASIEVPYLVPMLEKLEYDTIYHEHLSYFSVRALASAFAAAGLAIFDVVSLPIHGGTIRVLAKVGSEHGTSVAAAISRERQNGLERVETYLQFAQRVAENRTALRAMLVDLRGQGARIAAYGAPAKGNTLLNYNDIGTDLVEYTVDKSPLKVGRWTPGKHLPIRPQPFLEQDRPDYTLILPWNLTDEIVQQEAGYRRHGGRFLVPIPEPRILP
ncbi:MAG: class I SAM-dependent methyltransferase [Planctomycetota bacterium]